MVELVDVQANTAAHFFMGLRQLIASKLHLTWTKNGGKTTRTGARPSPWTTRREQQQLEEVGDDLKRLKKMVQDCKIIFSLVHFHFFSQNYSLVSCGSVIL